jgi:hypothetical protein
LPSNQLSPITDRVMNRLSRKITKAQEKIDTGTAEKEASWNEVIDNFSEFRREPGKARFICRDGYTLNWAKREGKTELDPQALRMAISEKLWDQITVRTVDSSLLEAAVIEGLISEETLKTCITTKPPTGIRLHEEWSKEDRERAIIYGIPEPKPTRE